MLVFVTAALVVTGWQVLRWCTNVPLWDDFDSFLGFLLHVEDAGSWWQKVGYAIEFHNEHRTFGSRVVVWAAHAAGLGMDFRVLGIAGAALLLPIAALFALPCPTRRERVVALFFAAALLFNLQHHENLFWGGSSADHLGVVPFALGSLWLLQRSDRAAFLGAVACAAYAGLTMAQGLLVLPAGLFALALAQRWREAFVWVVFATTFGTLWFMGYGENGADGLTQAGPALFGKVRFWLGLLGAPLAFGSRVAAPWVGLVVVLTAGALFARGRWSGRPYHLTVLVYLVLATLLIAAGRAGTMPDAFMVSRYRVLTCLLLAVLGVALWRELDGRRFGRVLQAALLLLAATHTVEQGYAHWNRGARFRERQLQAAAHYALTGSSDIREKVQESYRLGPDPGGVSGGSLRGSPTTLYYDLPKAEQILERCARLGIYDLAAVGREAAKELERAGNTPARDGR